VTPPEGNRKIAAALGGSALGARFELIDGIGHLPYLEAPERFNALVAEFLSKATVAA
jgi:pimeloyl-ACP methyl ester carboxylesterase